MLGWSPHILDKWSMTGMNFPIMKVGKRTRHYASAEVISLIKNIAGASCNRKIYVNSKNNGEPNE